MLTNKLASRAAGIILAGVWGLTSPVASAQSGETDAGEVAALGGIAFETGTKPALTGSTGISISRYAMAVFDTSFLPLGQHTIQSWPDRSTVDKSYLFDFGLDFHIRIPVKARWAPYGIAGAGLLWNRVRQNAVGPNGVAVVNHYEQFNGALHTGAGLRYYVGQNWGIRPEVKVIVSKHTYTQVLMGIFYVTPSNWP